MSEFISPILHAKELEGSHRIVCRQTAKQLEDAFTWSNSCVRNGQFLLKCKFCFDKIVNKIENCITKILWLFWHIISFRIFNKQAIPVLPLIDRICTYFNGRTTKFIIESQFKLNIYVPNSIPQQHSNSNWNSTTR